MNISKANSIESLIQQIGLKSAAAGGIYTWLDSTCDRVFTVDQWIVCSLLIRYSQVPCRLLGSEAEADGFRCCERRTESRSTSLRENPRSCSSSRRLFDGRKLENATCSGGERRCRSNERATGSTDRSSRTSRRWSRIQSHYLDETCGNIEQRSRHSCRWCATRRDVHLLRWILHPHVSRESDQQMEVNNRFHQGIDERVSKSSQNASRVPYPCERIFNHCPSWSTMLILLNGDGCVLHISWRTESLAGWIKAFQLIRHRTRMRLFSSTVSVGH